MESLVKKIKLCNKAYHENQEAPAQIMNTIY